MSQEEGPESPNEICTPHAHPWPRTSKNGVLGRSVNLRAHPSRRSSALDLQKLGSGSICTSLDAPLTQILGFEVPEMVFWELLQIQCTPLAQIIGLGAPGIAFWKHPQIAGRTSRADPGPRISRNGVLGGSADPRTHPHVDPSPRSSRHGVLEGSANLRVLRALRAPRALRPPSPFIKIIAPPPQSPSSVAAIAVTIIITIAFLIGIRT